MTRLTRWAAPLALLTGAVLGFGTGMLVRDDEPPPVPVVAPDAPVTHDPSVPPSTAPPSASPSGKETWVAPVTEFGDGAFYVSVRGSMAAPGESPFVAPGKYLTAGRSGTGTNDVCIWLRIDAEGSVTHRVRGQSDQVVLTPGAFIRSEGCQPWKRVGQ